MKNQVPHFLFKTADGDLVLVSSYEVADILLCDSFAISEDISDYGAQSFTLQSPRDSLPLVTSSSSHRTSKEEDILHLLGHLLLKIGLILPIIIFCSRMKHISFLIVPHMVRICWSRALQL